MELGGDGSEHVGFGLGIVEECCFFLNVGSARASICRDRTCRGMGQDVWEAGPVCWEGSRTFAGDGGGFDIDLGHVWPEGALLTPLPPKRGFRV
eukprot:358032-Chlamydomonas_euryale.AAC.6